MVRYLALALVGLIAACSPAPGVSSVDSTGDVSTIAVPGDGGPVMVRVSVDPADILPGGDQAVRVIDREGRLALVLDRRSSRPQGMSRCQAGEEVWLRAIDLETRTERYSRRVESCIRDIVSGEPLISWSADRREVTLNLLSEEPVRLLLGPDGEVAPAP